MLLTLSRRTVPFAHTPVFLFNPARFVHLRPARAAFPPLAPVATPVNSSISLIPMFRRDHGEDPANRCPISEAPYWRERSSWGREGVTALVILANGEVGFGVRS